MRRRIINNPCVDRRTFVRRFAPSSLFDLAVWWWMVPLLAYQESWMPSTSLGLSTLVHVYKTGCEHEHTQQLKMSLFSKYATLWRRFGLIASRTSFLFAFSLPAFWLPFCASPVVFLGAPGDWSGECCFAVVVDVVCCCRCCRHCCAHVSVHRSFKQTTIVVAKQQQTCHCCEFSCGGHFHNVGCRRRRRW